MPIFSCFSSTLVLNCRCSKFFFQTYSNLVTNVSLTNLILNCPCSDHIPTFYKISLILNSLYSKLVLNLVPNFSSSNDIPTLIQMFFLPRFLHVPIFACLNLVPNSFCSNLILILIQIFHFSNFVSTLIQISFIQALFLVSLENSFNPLLIALGDRNCSDKQLIFL